MSTAVFTVVRLLSPLPVSRVPPSVQLQVTCPGTSLRVLLVGIADTISGLINPSYPGASIYIPGALFDALVTWLSPVPFVSFNVNVTYTINNGKWSVTDVSFSPVVTSVVASIQSQLVTLNADAQEISQSVNQLNELVGEAFGSPEQAPAASQTKTCSGSGAPPARHDPHLKQQAK